MAVAADAAATIVSTGIATIRAPVVVQCVLAACNLVAEMKDLAASDSEATAAAVWHLLVKLRSRTENGELGDKKSDLRRELLAVLGRIQNDGRAAVGTRNCGGKESLGQFLARYRSDCLDDPGCDFADPVRTLFLTTDSHERHCSVLAQLGQSI
eukprot:SAG31_NODE_52_length_30366_cov_34.368586_4_plen_154_part_00